MTMQPRTLTQFFTRLGIAFALSAMAAWWLS
jgi:hypothetical protein